MFPSHTGSCVVLCLATALFAHAFAAESAPAGPPAEGSFPVVILLGDSIRMQYQGKVRSTLKGRATVWSPKENCCHTAFTIANLGKWVKGRNAAVVHINVGLHDLYINARTNQPRHSLDVYAKNLRTIFLRLKDLTDADIVFALTTPVNEERQAASKTYKRVVRRNPQIVTYNQKAAEIARECGVRVNDVHAAVLSGGVEAMVCDDGVHLSPKGVTAAAEQVTQSVMAVLAERAKR